MFQTSFVDPSYGAVIVLFIVILQSLRSQLLEIRYSQLDEIHHLLGNVTSALYQESIGWPKALMLLPRGSMITEGHDDGGDACSACKILESPNPLPLASCSPLCLFASNCSF